MTDIQAVHQSDINILREIDRLCQKYQIRYFLHGGTLIGAARHQGPIPWDDDADVVFLREDYDRFLTEAAKDLQEPYQLLMPDDMNGFFDFIPKVMDTSLQLKTQSFESEFDHHLGYPSVDLFVLDPLSRGIFGKLHLFLLKLNYALAMGHRPYVETGKYKGINRLGAVILPAVGKLIPLKTLRRLNLKLQRSLVPDQQTLFISNDRPEAFLVYRYRPEDYAESVRLPFGDTALSAPVGWKRILTETYGDFMSLPKAESRKPSHFILD